MSQRLWRDDCLLHCNMQYIIATELEFPCVATKYVYVTQPPNLNRFVWSQEQLEYINNHQNRMLNEVSSVPLKLHPWNQI